MSLLTIIIPVRNCEKYIQETLSALKTIKDSKILIADGNSSDKTIEIIKDFQNQNMNIEIISEKDDGQSDALNKLIQFVETPFFLWLNADDLINSKFIRFACDQIDLLDKDDIKEVISITSNSVFIDENSNFVKYQYALQDNSFLVKNGIWFGKFPCRIWNTDLVRKAGGLNKDLFYSMDFDLLRRQYLDNKRLKTIHSRKFMGAFRLHNNSKTGNPSNTPLVQDEMNKLLKRNKIEIAIAKFISMMLRVASVNYIFYRFFGKFFTTKDNDIF
jgi:glycosyltransferase involved in cell wall biosynthesis